MKNILKIYVLQTAGIFILTQMIPAVSLKNGSYGLLESSLILIILLKIIKPVVNLMMLPINLLTLNLTVWIVDILLIALWLIFTPSVQIASWHFNGQVFGPLTLKPLNLVNWQVIILSAILLVLILKFLNWIFK